MNRIHNTFYLILIGISFAGSPPDAGGGVWLDKWLTVDIGSGASCHVGYRSCFYRSIPLGKIKNMQKLEMKFKEKEKIFKPEDVYKDQPNPTKL